jgi:hypothetical protein
MRADDGKEANAQKTRVEMESGFGGVEERKSPITHK